MDTSQIYTLSEVAEITGLKEATLKKRCQRRTLPGIKTTDEKGNTVWGLSIESLNALLNNGKDSDYEQIHQQWINDMAAGHISGKPMGGGLKVNIEFMDSFWRHLGIPKSIAEINSHNLVKCIDNLKPDFKKKTCHYSIKTNIKKAMISFMKSLIRHGHKTEDDLLAISRIKIKRLFPEKRIAISYDKYLELLEFNENWLHTRNRYDIEATKTIIMLIMLGGLRREEVVTLEMDQIDYQNQQMTVFGKGLKYRTVGLCPELAEQLKHWIKYHRIKPNKPSNHLFISSLRKPMSKHTVSTKIRRISKASGIKITPHGLRRSCGTTLAANNMPVPMISQIYGHSSIQVTEKYILTDANEAARYQANRGRPTISTPQRESSAKKQESTPPRALNKRRYR